MYAFSRQTVYGRTKVLLPTTQEINTKITLFHKQFATQRPFIILYWVHCAVYSIYAPSEALACNVHRLHGLPSGQPFVPWEPLPVIWTHDSMASHLFNHLHLRAPACNMDTALWPAIGTTICTLRVPNCDVVDTGVHGLTFSQPFVPSEPQPVIWTHCSMASHLFNHLYPQSLSL